MKRNHAKASPKEIATERFRSKMTDISGIIVAEFEALDKHFESEGARQAQIACVVALVFDSLGFEADYTPHWIAVMTAAGMTKARREKREANKETT